MTDLATAYSHGPGRVVQSGPPPEVVAVTGTRVPLAELAAQGRFGAAVAHLLVDVASPLRWEPWNQYNDHRAYPSARAAYLVDIVVVVGHGRWTLDPVRRATIGDDAPVLGRTVRLDLVRHPERLSPGYHGFADVLTELEVGHLAAALVEHAEQLGLRATADGDHVVVRSDQETGLPVGPLPARSSGVGPRGIAADPRPLPAEALRAFVDAICGPELRHRLAVRNVVGIPDGWYAVNPLRLLAPGAAMHEVRDAFGHPATTFDVAGMNLALVTTADLAAADSYPALLRAAGACAQHVCSAAASAGMFCRPARSTTDERLEAAVHAPPSHSLLYLLAAGRPRATGFSYDLSPLEAP